MFIEQREWRWRLLECEQRGRRVACKAPRFYYQLMKRRLELSTKVTSKGNFEDLNVHDPTANKGQILHDLRRSAGRSLHAEADMRRR